MKRIVAIALSLSFVSCVHSNEGTYNRNPNSDNQNGRWPKRFESQVLLDFGQFERSELIIKGEIAEILFNDTPDASEEINHQTTRTRFSADGRVRCSVFKSGDAVCSLWVLRNNGSVPAVDSWKKQ